MNTEEGRVRYKFEVDRVTIWTTRRHTLKGAHTICVCNRLLFYSKCIMDLLFAWSIAIMYITQCSINVELPNLWYIVVLLPEKRLFERFWRILSLRSPVPSIISRTVNGKLKILQIRSKNRFWGKRTTIYYRLANLTLIYIAIGQANGKSNTFTIKWQSITHTDFVGLLCTPTKHSKEYPPAGGGGKCIYDNE